MSLICRESIVTKQDDTKQLNQEKVQLKQTQQENDIKDDELLDSSVNSMDVSTSTTSNTNIFESPPKGIHNDKIQIYPKTPTQKRRQRRYNIRKIQRRKKHSHSSKPMIASKQKNKLNKTQATSTTMSTTATVFSRPETRQVQNESKPENKQPQKGTRLVDFISDSNGAHKKGDSKGLMITSEPNGPYSPNYTLNYVSIDDNLVKEFNEHTNIKTSVTSQRFEVNDTMIYINEILFQFTSGTTGENWYYCHYLDLDYHGNIILLNARDTPPSLIHKFNVEHNFYPNKKCDCKVCKNSENDEKETIGYFTPCYLHKNKQNKTHYHITDKIDIIKHVQRICFKQNKLAKSMVLNPIIDTEKVDEQRDIYCSTILPTNNVLLTTVLTKFTPMEEEDIIYGLKQNSMTLPGTIKGDTCGKTHHRTISYCEYGTGFICDRCGYGYNSFDIIYVCDETPHNKTHTCKEKDICCKCAIQIMDAQKQDMDVDTQRHLQQKPVKSNIYNTINIPMLNTRFVHQGKTLHACATTRVLINYNLRQQQKEKLSIVYQQEEHKEQQDVQVNAQETNIHLTRSLKQPQITTTQPTTPATATTIIPIDLTETDDEEYNNIGCNETTMATINTNNLADTLNQPTLMTSQANTDQTKNERQRPEQQNTLVNNSDDNDTDSEAPPLMISSRISYLQKLSHTPPKNQQQTTIAYNPEPPHKRRCVPHNHNTQTNQEKPKCTQCNTEYTMQELWKCNNKFQCNKLLCLNCLIKNGYNKYYMLNCQQHWYCNECLDENIKKRQEYEHRHRHQHQSHHHKKKRIHYCQISK